MGGNQDRMIVSIFNIQSILYSLKGRTTARGEFVLIKIPLALALSGKLLCLVTQCIISDDLITLLTNKT